MTKKQAQVEAAPEVKAAAAQINLRDLYISLNKKQQEAAVQYFNAYNLAAWLFNEVCDPDCKNYIDQAVKYAQELRAMEQIPHSDQDDVVQEFVDKFNSELDGK